MAVCCVSTQTDLKHQSTITSRGTCISSLSVSKCLAGEKQQKHQEQEQLLQSSPDPDTNHSIKASSGDPDMYLVAVSRRGGVVDLLLCLHHSNVEKPLSVVADQLPHCVHGEEQHAQAMHICMGSLREDAPECANSCRLCSTSAQELHECRPSGGGGLDVPASAATNTTQHGGGQLQSWHTQAACKPCWLQDMALSAPSSNSGRADRQNLWMPLSWLPQIGSYPSDHSTSFGVHTTCGRRVVRNLLAGRPDGSLQAWRVSLDATQLQARLEVHVLQHGHTTHHSDTMASTIQQHLSGSWKRTDEMKVARRDTRDGAAEGEQRTSVLGSWHAAKTDRPIHVESLKVYSNLGHSSMLFTLHVKESASTACSAIGLDGLSKGQSDDTSPTDTAALELSPHCLELWSTSLDRKVILSEISTLAGSDTDACPQVCISKDSSRHLSIVSKVSWHCTGAPITAMTAVSFCTS
jgi:hypothetical protein